MSNSGDMHIDGTLHISAYAGLNNAQNLEAGALTGNEIARIIVDGNLINRGRMTLYPTAEMTVGVNGYFYNDGHLNDMRKQNP